LCQRGFHASVRVLDALRYAQGAVICRVRLSGIIVRGDDKVVASSREVLWMADATETLHLFACDEAERAMARVENPDQRSVAAIVAKRAWLRGEITDKQLAAARDAAWAAAWDAARAAAWDAASAAAWDAAWAAASAAAWDAAWAAAWDAQNKRLTAALMKLRPKGTK
jgi:hypothetical protein